MLVLILLFLQAIEGDSSSGIDGLDEGFGAREGRFG